ncbi:MAG: glucuronate isomerase [Spirochaetaceae bacterium]|nr:glucuronate isomerase [Spirochaetaceae bacterium]
MKPFLDKDFLLQTEAAKTLYHKYAAKMPIFDYHCHLNPKEIWEDKSYADLAELWLGGDHYKWRLMRACGVPEEIVTGKTTDGKEKFTHFVKAIEKSIGNPVYHWSHLELQRFFNINLPLISENIDAIWEEANKQLKDPAFTARRLIERSNVTALCTTDDPADSLEYHQKIRDEGKFKVKVLPTFRPDKAIYFNNPVFFGPWLEALEKVSGKKVNSFAGLKQILTERIDFFHSLGCRVSDHALDPVVYQEATEAEAEAALTKVLAGKTTELTESEIKAYQSRIMLFLGNEYHKRGWVMQLHLGVNRNNNSAKFAKLGADTGFDAIGDKVFAKDLVMLLDALNTANSLPKTILYSLNDRENMVLSTIAGCFQGESFGKMQLGSAWWFNDHKTGMEKQIIDLANSGVLGSFVGMLTDSRSFISYPRHEYFRRILCNMVGTWAENGEIHFDEKKIGAMIEDICYNNVIKYVNI